MSGIVFRVPVTMTAILVVAAGATVCDLPVGTGATGVLTGGAVPGRWPPPLDVAPAKIDKSVSTVIYDCGNQSPINVVSIDSNVTLNGSCGEVDVSGSANTVNLQTVAIIKATGSGNHITWQQGPGAGPPRISNPGGSNSIVGPAGIQAPSGRG
ncbi:hypothetical protein A5653_05380 [Mycobacterium colombiense]|uniref:DUF3060 domain-containing protein n=1 Tax=Mycobacterium colombiense TaxID=339268 RepID=UPI0007EFEDFE|nr:DUF3060 domain-containing protein [Mycobacterium colombiense]OBK60065.1 hypothetical protein A5653_05380 [Mycobacterium colombiense]